LSIGKGKRPEEIPSLPSGNRNLRCTVGSETDAKSTIMVGRWDNAPTIALPLHRLEPTAFAPGEEFQVEVEVGVLGCQFEPLYSVVCSLEIQNYPRAVRDARAEPSVVG
jgi:hypothetical protein